MSVEKAKNVPPFVLWCSATIPTAFDDSMSYYEALCALNKFIQDNIISVVNNNADILKEYIKMVDDLKEYVDNYFENLDVQEEINNKLDEMAEGGQLAAIIAQFLAMSPVFGFGTIAEMSSATNLINGSIARVIGNTTASDGDGAYYLVRTRIESDDPDGLNLVAIGDSLVGVRVIENLTPKYLLVGDSYATGYQGSGVPTITGFFDRVKNTLNLDATIVAANGYGFLGMGNTNKWENLIDNANIQNKESYTDIIIAGGMNDNTGGLSTQIDSTIAYLKTSFPNAKIHIAMIGRYGGSSAGNLSRIRDVYNVYKKGASRNGCAFIENAQYILHNIEFFISDMIHPTEAGQTYLAQYFEEYINSGSMTVFYPTQTGNILNDSNVSGNFSVYTSLENNITRVFMSGRVTFVNNIATLSNLNSVTIGTLTRSYLCGSENNQGLCIEAQGYAWSQTDNKPHRITMRIKNNENNQIIVTFFLVGEDGTYSLTDVNEINIVGGVVSDTVASMYC